MFNPIEKFKCWCQHVLPLVYDDSLSYYEAICKLTQKINEMIERINGLPDYIQSLINTISPQPANPTVLTPFHNKGQLVDSKLILNASEQVHNIQGGCSDGTYYYVFRRGTGAGAVDKYFMNNGDSEIQTWTLEETQPIDCGHANGAWYNPFDGYIYVTALITDNNEPDNRIFKVDPKTLSIVWTKTLDFPFWGIAFNNKRKMWGGWIDNPQRKKAPYRFAAYDENWNLLWVREMPIYIATSRVGMYADENYIYILYTGVYGATRTELGVTNDGIHVLNWDLEYVTNVNLNNIEELEHIAWTGKSFVAGFYSSWSSGLASYASLCSIKLNDIIPRLFYTQHLNNNITIYENNTGFYELNTVLPLLDPYAIYGASHLEIDWRFNAFLDQPKFVTTIPVLLGQSQRIELTACTGSNFIAFEYVIYMGGRDDGYGNLQITAFRGYRINGTTGDITKYTPDMIQSNGLGITEIRACNYTVNNYNAFKKRST